MNPEQGRQLGRAVSRLLRPRATRLERRQDMTTLFKVLTHTMPGCDDAVVAAIRECEFQINGGESA